MADAQAHGSLPGAPPADTTYELDDRTVAVTASDRLFFDVLGKPALSLVVSYAPEPGFDRVIAEVWVDEERSHEVAGVVRLTEYNEETERNPSDAYTNGEKVTARRLRGTLRLDATDAVIEFEFAQSLHESCFDCDGIEGCNF
jgi:hypothetical protein